MKRVGTGQVGRAEIPKGEAFAVGSIRVDEMNNYGIQAE